MASSDKRKQSLYFPEEMLKEIQDEANRLDRSLSWMVQHAWRLARHELARYPSVNDVDEGQAAESGSAPATGRSPSRPPDPPRLRSLGKER